MKACNLYIKIAAHDLNLLRFPNLAACKYRLKQTRSLSQRCVINNIDHATAHRQMTWVLINF